MGNIDVLEKMKKERIGMHVTNLRGYGAICTDYKNANHITIQYDGTDVTHRCSWTSFISRRFKDPPFKHVGERRQNNQGVWMTILEYKNASHSTVKFDSGYICTNVQYHDFLDGGVKDLFFPDVCGIGYIGKGRYKSTENHKPSIAYQRWIAMLVRANGKKQNCPTYEECSVCEEWHNFQNFAAWFYQQYYEVPNQVMSLDKDILFKGNKLYSPHTCCIVPQDINVLFTNRTNDRGDYPIGVSQTTWGHRYSAIVNKEGRSHYLGSFNTPEEAFYAYKAAKEAHIKQMADKYKQWLPDKVYQAMYAYEIDIND